jgi:hypothetical protein
MIQKFFLGFFVCLFFFGCCTSHIFIGSTNSKYISIDKIRLHVIKNGDDLNGKGSIKIYKDSIINFRFFGPLGYEVLKGSYSHSLNVYSVLEKKNYEDLDLSLKVRYGIQLSRKCCEFLLIGDIDDLKLLFIQENLLNKDLRIITGPHLFEVTNIRNGEYLRVSYRFKKDFPRKVIIYLGNGIENNEISMDYIKTSFNQ